MIDPDAKVGLFTRLWDWLTYQPWTDDEIAEQVAKSVANTCYEKWHDKEMYIEIPMVGVRPLHWRDAETEFVRDDRVTEIQFEREEDSP